MLLNAMPLLLLSLMLVTSGAPRETADGGPLRVGVAGLTHGHVGWILGREDDGLIRIVGIAEPDRELARRYAARFGFSMDLVYPTLEEMLDATRPEAITAFNDIAAHLPTVEAAARRGIHVMVEKPLHFSLDAARRMKAVADSAKIHLLTNYETTWYATTRRSKDLVDSGDVGALRKIVVHDGHQGPSEIGVGPEFLEWLTDPARNGGGALIDFGCYGADLITWLLQGERPQNVTAVTQTLKPGVYPRVDDEATIILTYPGAQGIIQASWNWPYARKDMEIYGTDGAVMADDAVRLRVRRDPGDAFETSELDLAAEPFHRDPFAYLEAVVRGRIDPTGSPSSLDVNMVVVEILDAARRSAETGRTIHLPHSP